MSSWILYSIIAILFVVIAAMGLLLYRLVRYALDLADFHSNFTQRVDEMIRVIEKYTENPLYEFDEEKIRLHRQILHFRQTLELALRGVRVLEDADEEDENDDGDEQ